MPCLGSCVPSFWLDATPGHRLFPTLILSVVLPTILSTCGHQRLLHLCLPPHDHPFFLQCAQLQMFTGHCS
ncbi:hypothetical protein E2I00_016296, partial [Balaenoptera physalus]